MSRLIDIDPQVQPEPKPEGYEFGYYTFDELPKLEVSHVDSTIDSVLDIQDKNIPDNESITLPMSNDILLELQQKDAFCKNILEQIEKGNIIEVQLYLVREKILKRYVQEGDNSYKTTVLPKALTAQVLKMAHD